MIKNEEELRKNIGKRIKIARLRTNYTQAELAEEISVSTEYISQLERGIHFGSASTIINLCKALDISSNFLFSDLVDNNSSETNNMIDNNFLSDYLKLSETNKEIISAMTNVLLKIQSK